MICFGKFPNVRDIHVIIFLYNTHTHTHTSFLPVFGMIALKLFPSILRIPFGVPHQAYFCCD